jgi:hypothetical protein
MPPGELTAADAGEAAHDAGDGAEQAEQRREGDDGVHGAQKAARIPQFLACGHFQGPLHAGVTMVEAVVDHAYHGIGRFGGLGDGLGEVSGLQLLIHLVELLHGTLGGETQPPENALDEDADGKQSHHRDGVHDGTTFEEEIDDDVGEHG